MIDENESEVEESVTGAERWINSIDAVAKVRNDRQQQQERQQQIEAAPAMAAPPVVGAGIVETEPEVEPDFFEKYGGVKIMLHANGKLAPFTVDELYEAFIERARNG